MLKNTILKDCILNDKCSYIDNYEQSTHYKIIDRCSITLCEKLVESGWRRFGKMFFRPVCETCQECQSLKIDVKNFQFSKSKKRIIKKNNHLRIMIRRPTMTVYHLDLFKRYHDFKQEVRGWEKQKSSAQNYHASFVQGHEEFGYEILYFDENKLIAVDLVDILPNGISSIYFYHDPDYMKNSLGHYSLYRQIMLAKERNLDWIYLGYYVEGCQSLEYKKDYIPLLKLDGRPDMHESFKWSLKL